MPELCEVEIMARELNEIVSFGTILEVKLSPWYLQSRVSKHASADIRPLVGWTFSKVERKGKALLFCLETPPLGTRYIASRLGMTGNWLVKPSDFDYSAITHWAVALLLSRPRGNVWLIYADTRRFGSMEVGDNIGELKSLSAYGPEILSAQFTQVYLDWVCKGKRVPIKALLLDQGKFPGIGNWLANEILFVAHIRPQQLAGTLKTDALKRLFQAIHLVISAGIQSGGASFRDWLHASGIKGKAQESFYIYGKANQPCQLCGAIIQKSSIRQRSVFWCPQCQRDDWTDPAPVEEAFVQQIILTVLKGE